MINMDLNFLSPSLPLSLHPSLSPVLPPCLPPSLPPSLRPSHPPKIRAVNQFVVGNWSNATEITIALPPLPRPSNMTDIDPKTSTALPTAESNVYSVTIDATWSMPEEINGNLTGYDAHIGLLPLQSDPFLNDEGSLEITSFKVSLVNNVGKMSLGGCPYGWIAWTCALATNVIKLYSCRKLREAI